MKIAIVTDSTCDLSPEMLKENNIFVLPLKVICSDGEYRDGIDITNEQLVERFEKEIPTTSMPSPGEVKALFEEIRDKGYDQILSIHISSGLSGTFNNVKMVAQEFPDLKIEVIDSKMLSLGLGILVLNAVKLNALGLKLAEIVQKIEKMKENTKVFFVVKTLEYLKRGGRIGKISASLGEILDIKPIISINEEGQYYPVAKVRGRKRSLEKVMEIITKEVEDKKITLAVAHSNAEEECKNLLNNFLNKLGNNVKQFLYTDLGPGMVVHCGPGLVGVIYSIEGNS